MKTIKTSLYKSGMYVLLSLIIPALLISCEVEDPFVDRTVSPVLIVFDEVPGYLAGGGLTATPAITKIVNAGNYTNPVVLSLTLYELDKSGLLDHNVGIDSIPVVGVPMTFSKRDGTVPIETISDDLGKVSITTTWQDLGISSTQMTSIISSSKPESATIQITWRGSYKGQSFSRYAQVVMSKP